MKKIPDIIHNELVEQRKTTCSQTNFATNWYGHSSLNNHKPVKNLPDYPVGLKIGDKVYVWSVGVGAWLKGFIADILPPEKRVGNQANAYISYRSPEHLTGPKEEYYTQKIRNYMDKEIADSRDEYFKKHPHLKRLI